MGINLENTVGLQSVSMKVTAYTIYLVNNLDPQTTFPVPEGILNYNGINYIALTLWALDENGARIDRLELVASRPIFSGYRRPDSAPQPAWEERLGAY